MAVTGPSVWVEDEGRAQGLGLRTGTHVDPVLAYYNGLSVTPESGDVFIYEEVKVSNGAKAYYSTCRSKFLEGDRDIWREGHGWSGEGTVFLEVTFNWCTYDNLLWHLDRDVSLNARSGEDRVAPLSWERTELDDGALRLYGPVRGAGRRRCDHFRFHAGRQRREPGRRRGLHLHRDARVGRAVVDALSRRVDYGRSRRAMPS